jgi:hypothetical protein
MKLGILITAGIHSDGIVYDAYLAADRIRVEVRHPDGRSLRENFDCAYTPRFGIDAMDVHTVHEVLERLIKEIKENK